MLNQKLAAAQGIARRLGASERALDTTIVENAGLLISIVEGGIATATAAQDSQPAIANAMAGLTLLGEAREQIVLCHQQLATLRDAHKLSPQATGCSMAKIFGGLAAVPAEEAA